jgi:hypothetical protein
LPKKFTGACEIADSLLSVLKLGMKLWFLRFFRIVAYELASLAIRMVIALVLGVAAALGIYAIMSKPGSLKVPAPDSKPNPKSPPKAFTPANHYAVR